MHTKTAQWVLWAALMLVFSALTLAGRWLDLALALTISAVIWYGIVPEPSSRDNNPKAAKSR
ncbi:MAG TPA: hypothetical protein VE779_11755 [Candidatus Angelobacter sp.]|jgi:hypothetical protein|nr:hypothetical protein [Candidatus Angelobacter sp.]